MKTFIRNNSTFLLSSALFVSLCANYMFSFRILSIWLRGETMKEHLFYNDHYRLPLIYTNCIVLLLLTIMAGVIVRYLYRQQKREHGKLSVWRWVGIIVIGVLSLILPLISWWYGVKIFLIYAVMYSITVIVYLILSNRKTVSHSFEKEALANSYSGNTMESGDHFKKRGESEKPDE
ncbi:MAG: hypothetical protein LBS55_08405 [Prevotellaceae bacterium]|nr:hypothetical protein [Prevotellaceae bacterium]